MSDVAVVTANIGNYDAPLSQDGVHTLCYEAGDEHPRLAAKRAKMLDVRPEGEFQYIVWIDANMTIKTPTFAEDVAKWCGNAPLALWQHPDRSTIRDEAAASLALAPEKYMDQPLAQQIDDYSAQGFQDDWGLYATGCLVWNTAHPMTGHLAAEWLDHNFAWSYQDQISLPFVLWELDLRPALLPYDLRANPWLQIGAHQRND